MSNKTEDGILSGALEDFAKSFAKNEEIGGILKKAESGEITEEVAMSQLMEAVIAKPELQQQLIMQAMTTLAPAGEQLIENYPETYQPPSGMPRRDPLLEAKLVERLQFDGDAPEMRDHVLGQGIRPAVPVSGATANPVALGWSLEQASDEVLAEIKLLTDKVTNSEEASTDLVEASSNTALATQPVGFKPGEVPALRDVQNPTGSQLMALPEAKQKELAWGSFSTSQGRRSAAPTLANMVEVKLKNMGFNNASVGAHGGQMKNSTEGVVAKAAWVISILGSGPMSTNEGFSVMENAAAAIASELKAAAENLDDDLYSIEVCTVDTYARRQVGWAALLRK